MALSLCFVCIDISAGNGAWCLSGQVTSGGQSLAGASVELRSKPGTTDSRRLGRGATRVDGRFEFAYADPGRGVYFMGLEVRAEDHIDFTRILDCVEHCGEQTVEMERKEVQGREIYIAEYDMYHRHDEDDADVKEAKREFNQKFHKMVYWRIESYKNDIGASGLGVISVKKLDKELMVSDGESVRKHGYDRSALAMVVGEGNINLQNEEPLIELESVFHTMPSYRGEKHAHMISDSWSVSWRSPKENARGLSEDWGEHAILAFVLQRLATQNGAWSRSEVDGLLRVLGGVVQRMSEEDTLLEMVMGVLSEVEIIDDFEGVYGGTCRGGGEGGMGGIVVIDSL